MQFFYTGNIQTYTVPVSGSYQLASIGAAGGKNSNGDLGGKGAQIAATIHLSTGTVLYYVVGGVGQDGRPPGPDFAGGGGGGGTFVYTNLATPLMVAGGGGGAGSRVFNNSGGQVGLDANAAGTSGVNGASNNLGGSNGLGGNGNFGGGGAGFLGNGGNGIGSGGIAAAGGFLGGNGNQPGGNGGFGGGGGSFAGGGGGGGYSGGGGGSYSGGGSGRAGGGGGSFTAAGATNIATSITTSIASFDITLVSADAVNTVPSLASINGYNFSNSVLSGSATYASVAGDYCAITQTNGSGYYGSINTLISAANLVALSNPSLQSTRLLSNGEQLLPQAPLNLAVLNQFIEPSASALHYLFASGLTSGSNVSLTNSAGLTPYLTQVVVVNCLNNSTATLNISNFNGIVISGKGVSVTGLTTENHVIGCGNASYTFGTGTQTMALAGGSAFIDGTNGINTVVVQDTAYFKLAVSTTLNGGGTSTQIWTNQGVSTLVNVDYLQFNDRTIAINVGIGQSGGQAYRLYQAAFDRAPDTAGLSNWITQLDKGASLVTIANAFMNSAEFVATYGNNLTNGAFINALYSNVLDRAGDVGGQAYWLGTLNSGASRAQVLASFSESNENAANVASLIGNGIEYQIAA